MALNLDQLAARWILGLMSGSEIANAATQALAEGYDGPGLRVVAGTVDPDLSDVNAEFERALDELKAPRPSRKAAALLLARDYASRILEGSLGPYEGAKKISVDLAREIRPDDHTLDPFIYWSDEHDDAHDADRRRYCELTIIQSARDLLMTG